MRGMVGWRRSPVVSGPLGHLVALVPDERPGRPRRLSRAAGVARSRVRLVAARRWCRWERAISSLIAGRAGGFRRRRRGRRPGSRRDRHALFRTWMFSAGRAAARGCGTPGGNPAFSCRAGTMPSPPPRTAFDLHRAWPGSDLVIVGRRPRLERARPVSSPCGGHRSPRGTNHAVISEDGEAAGDRRECRRHGEHAVGRRRRGSNPAPSQSHAMRFTRVRDQPPSGRNPRPLRVFQRSTLRFTKGDTMTRTGSFAVGNPT